MQPEEQIRGVFDDNFVIILFNSPIKPMLLVHLLYVVGTR